MQDPTLEEFEATLVLSAAHGLGQLMVWVQDSCVDVVVNNVYSRAFEGP